jgi:hypothetical protein
MFEFLAVGESQYQEEVFFAETLIVVPIVAEVQTPLITFSQSQEAETTLGKTSWPAA